MRNILVLTIALLLTCFRITPALAVESNDTLENSMVALGVEMAADLQHADSIAITLIDSEPLNVTAAVPDNSVMQACANCNKRMPAASSVEPAYALYDATESPGTVRHDVTDDIALQYTVLTALKPQATAPPLRC